MAFISCWDNSKLKISVLSLIWLGLNDRKIGITFCCTCHLIITCVIVTLWFKAMSFKVWFSLTNGNIKQFAEYASNWIWLSTHIVLNFGTFLNGWYSTWTTWGSSNPESSNCFICLSRKLAIPIALTFPFLYISLKYYFP